MFLRLIVIAGLAWPSVAATAGAQTIAQKLASDENPAVSRGQDAFQDDCSLCHRTATGNGGDQGPALNGVVGRKAGSVPGYAYSKAMMAKGAVWTRENLDAFLADPQAVVPGTAMPFNVGDAQARADLIAYLATTR